MPEQNQSHFIRTLTQRFKVDLEKLWQDAMVQKGDYACKRAFDDRVEKRFWASFSNRYDAIPSLYDYAPHVLDRILFHTRKDKTMIEIGCGTGKFTLPMLTFARHIRAVDFSSHMLARCAAKIPTKHRHKITLVQKKWEEDADTMAHCVYSVNAVYRMKNIRDALSKMNRSATEKVVIVWTMQRSIFDRLINQFHKTGLARNQEYIHLLALLYELGIDPGLEIINADKPVRMCLKQAEHELKTLAIRNKIPQKDLQSAFEKTITFQGDTIFFNVPLTIALIHWAPVPGL